MLIFADQSTQITVPTTPSLEQNLVFLLAAELFSVLSTPIRLQILSALCHQEKSVSQLLLEIDTTQPNLSQHLAILFSKGVLAKRKQGTQVIYRVQSEQAVALCRSVCTQFAIQLDDAAVAPNSLVPNSRVMQIA